MKTFLQFLTERKNLHLEHTEDLIFLEGIDGLRDSINYLRSVRDKLASNKDTGTFISSKWDGAPAVFAGPDPESGKFFVGTKSVFNKNPKLNFTKEDIDLNHGNSAELAKKLKVSLEELSKLNLDRILQGDLLFINEDLKQEEIEGTSYLTFKPNTLLYAVPTDSELAKTISKANIGIVFHTEYSGESIQDLDAKFINELPPMNETSDVWVQSPKIKNVDDEVLLSKEQTKEINDLLSEIGREFNRLDSSFIREVTENNELRQIILMHLNELIKQGIDRIDPKQHIKSLINFINNRFENEAQKKKQEKTKEKHRQRAKELVDYIEENATQFEIAFDLMYNVRNVKQIIVRKLESIKTETDIFVDTKDGYKVASQEGFVAVSADAKNAVKLVDRLGFSLANFKNQQFG